MLESIKRLVGRRVDSANHAFATMTGIGSCILLAVEPYWFRLGGHQQERIVVFSRRRTSRTGMVNTGKSLVRLAATGRLHRYASQI